MNSAAALFCNRFFYTSASLRKTSAQAKFMVKVLGATNKRKTRHYFQETSSNFQELFEGSNNKANKNPKVSSRRISVLNSIYLERITDILSASNFDHNLHEFGFLITKVKYENDGSALHVYWYADSNIDVIENKLPQVGGWLKHQLSQLYSGRVPHINFIFDRSNFKATDVEELLKVADFGPDFVPSSSSSTAPDPSTSENLEKLSKRSDVLGIDRNAIMNQVMKTHCHMNEPSPSRTANTFCDDVQRRIDFKKFLREQEIMKNRLEKNRSRSQCLYVDPTELSNNDDDDDYYDEMEEEDYYEDQVSDEIDK